METANSISAFAIVSDSPFGSHLETVIMRVEGTLHASVHPLILDLQHAVSREQQQIDTSFDEIATSVSESQRTTHLHSHGLIGHIKDIETKLTLGADSALVALEHCKEGIEQLAGRANEMTKASSQLLAQISHRIDQFDAQVKDAARRIEDELSLWHHHLTSATEDTKGLHDRLAYEIGSFMAQSSQELQTVNQAYRRFSEQAAEQLTALSSSAESAARTLETQCEHLYLNQMIPDIGQAGSQVLSVMQSFQQAATRFGAQFDGSAKRFLDQINEIAQIMSAIRPVLDAVKAVL